MMLGQRCLVRVIKNWDVISVEPGGCPTSGSTSAGRKRVGRAAPIPSSEHLSSPTFSNQSLNGNCTSPKFSTTTHQLILSTCQHAVNFCQDEQDHIKTSPILSASILATKKSKSAMSSDAKLWSSFMKMCFIHNHSMIQILSQYDKLYAYLHKCIIIAKPGQIYTGQINRG